MNDLQALFHTLSGLLEPSELAFCLVQLERIPGEHANAFLQQLPELSNAALLKARDLMSQFRDPALLYVPDSLALLCDIAADEPSRLRLSRNQGFHFNGDPALPLQLNFGSAIFETQLPAHCGAWALIEVFLHRPIEASDTSAVETIYDLGAYVGIAALRLHALNPKAHLVCAEPSQANLPYLQRNLAVNRIPHTLIPLPITGAGGPVNFAGDSGPSMLNSCAFDVTGGSALLQSVSLSSLMRNGRYGIKMDIEGAEFGLQACADILKNAEWIIGELHYGEFSTPTDRWLPELLRENFHVRFYPPKIDCWGGQFIVGQDFKARRR